MKGLVLSLAAACAAAPFWCCVADAGIPQREVYYLAAHGCDDADGRTEATAWRTTAKLNRSLPAGAEARLRRGDVFHGPIRVKGGKTKDRPTAITAFGEGPDPEISLYKTAVPETGRWERIAENLWRIDLCDPASTSGNPVENGNIGFLLVDGTIHGRKLFGETLPSRQWEFKDDCRKLTVWSRMNPATMSKDIRFAPCVNGICFAKNLSVSHVTVRGAGAHGVSGTGENVTIRDCTFAEIGGSVLTSYPVKNVRYGNGVECWSDSVHILVERCVFRDIYDVAFTMQGPSPHRSWENIHMRDCEVVRCTQAFEVWTTKCRPGIGMKNCSFVRNRCTDIGYCWGYDVRPNKNVSAPLLVYSMETDSCDIKVESNTFVNNRQYLIFNRKGLGHLPDGYRVFGNRIVNRGERPVGNAGGKEQEVRAARLEAEIRTGHAFVGDFGR